LQALAICIHLGIDYLSGETEGVPVGDTGEDTELADSAVIFAGFRFDFSRMNSF
jgi:hypothetical protein